MNELVTKICKKCGQVKSIEEFSKDARSRDGHSMYCKDCTRDISRKSYEKMKMRSEARRYGQYFGGIHSERPFGRTEAKRVQVGENVLFAGS